MENSVFLEITGPVSCEPFNLAYNKGDKAHFEPETAKLLLEKGVAIPAEDAEAKKKGNKAGAETAKADKADAETGSK